MVRFDELPRFPGDQEAAGAVCEWVAVDELPESVGELGDYYVVDHTVGFVEVGDEDVAAPVGEVGGVGVDQTGAAHESDDTCSVGKRYCFVWENGTERCGNTVVGRDDLLSDPTPRPASGGVHARPVVQIVKPARRSASANTRPVVASTGSHPPLTTVTTRPHAAGLPAR